MEIRKAKSIEEVKSDKGYYYLNVDFMKPGCSPCEPVFMKYIDNEFHAFIRISSYIPMCYNANTGHNIAHDYTMIERYTPFEHNRYQYVWVCKGTDIQIVYDKSCEVSIYFRKDQGSKMTKAVNDIYERDRKEAEASIERGKEAMERWRK